MPVVLVRSEETARRRRQRRPQLRGARRAHAAAFGGRDATRPGSALGEAPQAEGHRGQPAPRRQSGHHAEAARASAGASSCCASISRRRPRARCSPPSSPNSTQALADCDVVHPVGLRQGRPRAHREHDPQRAPRRQARAGRPEGRRLLALQGRAASSRRTVAELREVVGRWKDETDLSGARRRCARSSGWRRCC